MGARRLVSTHSLSSRALLGIVPLGSSTEFDAIHAEDFASGAQILSPVRLPVPPHSHTALNYNSMLRFFGQAFFRVTVKIKRDELLLDSGGRNPIMFAG